MDKSIPIFFRAVVRFWSRGLFAQGEDSLLSQKRELIAIRTGEMELVPSSFVSESILIETSV